MRKQADEINNIKTTEDFQETKHEQDQASLKQEWQTSDTDAHVGAASLEKRRESEEANLQVAIEIVKRDANEKLPAAKRGAGKVVIENWRL